MLVGAVVMRGAGCTFNDIVDTDIDMKVARTRSRPIPSGQVTTRQAALFLVVQSLVGLVDAAAVQRRDDPARRRLAGAGRRSIRS